MSISCRKVHSFPVEPLHLRRVAAEGAGARALPKRTNEVVFLREVILC